MSPTKAHSLTSRRTTSYLGTTSTATPSGNNTGEKGEAGSGGIGGLGISTRTGGSSSRSRSGSSSDSGASRRNSHTDIEDINNTTTTATFHSTAVPSPNSSSNNIATSYFVPKHTQSRRFLFPFRRRRSSTITPTSFNPAPLLTHRRGLRRIIHRMMTSTTFRRHLAPITQRLPMLSHFGMVPFALLGPRYIPWFFGVCLILVHCMLMTVNIR